MMYEKTDLEAREVSVTEAKPVAPTMEDTIDALVEIHCQLSGLAEFLFGDIREPSERPEIKCLEDSALKGNSMTKYALERIMMIKSRLGA